MTDVCELLDRARRELRVCGCENEDLFKALALELENCRGDDTGDRWWTVLLLWPEAVTDDYGKDTYRTFVEAETPARALELARQEALAQHVGDDGNYADLGFPAEDLHLLSLVKGKVFSYDDGWGGVSDSDGNGRD